MRAIALTLLLASATLFAQQPAPAEAPAAPQKHAREYIIAVTVQSRDPRVKLISDHLDRAAAEVVNKSADNTRAIIVVGTKRETIEQARRRRADYLLTIDFAPHSTASVEIGPGAGRPRDPEVFGSPSANMQGRMFLAWTIQPFNDNKVKLHDSRYVQPMEYPLPDGSMAPDWVANIADRSVRDAAAAAMSKLKLKKGLDLQIETRITHDR